MRQGLCPHCRPRTTRPHPPFSPSRLHVTVAHPVCPTLSPSPPQTLRPLGPFATPEREAAYVPISAGEQVMNVLKKIALAG